jgi:hypothetical protein
LPERLTDKIIPSILRRSIAVVAGVKELMLRRPDVSRRSVLVSLGAAPLASRVVAAGSAPDSTGHSEAPDAAPRTRHVFTALLRISLAGRADASVGSAIILGGEARGELAGVVQPGSLEWTRDPVHGVLQLATRFEMQSRAGTRIHVADRATVISTSASCWEAAFATTPELTVVDGPSEACREAVYLGRMDASQIGAGELRLSVHRVL